jgi:hypothetical protein
LQEDEPAPNPKTARRSVTELHSGKMSYDRPGQLAFIAIAGKTFECSCLGSVG